MKTLTTEPSALILHRVYEQELERPIVIDGRRGVLASAGGCFGEVAIRATFGDIEIVARERESQDYEQWDGDDCPERLEVYDWELEDEPGVYYSTLSNALARRHPGNRAFI